MLLTNNKVQIIHNLNGLCVSQECEMHTVDTKIHKALNHACTQV